MRSVRERKGWSQRKLSAELAEHGVKLSPTSVLNIEAGTRRVTLDEALAIAAALDVAPMWLFLPRDPSEPFAATPNDVVGSVHAESWVQGFQPLDMLDVDEASDTTRTYFTEAPPLIARLNRNPAFLAWERVHSLIVGLITRGRPSGRSGDRAAAFKDARRKAQRAFDEIEDLIAEYEGRGDGVDQA